MARFGESHMLQSSLLLIKLLGLVLHRVSAGEGGEGSDGTNAHFLKCNHGLLGRHLGQSVRNLNPCKGTGLENC